MSDRELFDEVARWLRYAREVLDIAESIIENEQVNLVFRCSRAE